MQRWGLIVLAFPLESHEGSAEVQRCRCALGSVVGIPTLFSSVPVASLSLKFQHSGTLPNSMWTNFQSRAQTNPSSNPWDVRL